MEVLGKYLGPTTPEKWRDECLAAVIVCFAQIPACVAFAALAHCSPAAGLHAGWIVGLTCALFGGRPGMIVGSAGALASVSQNFVSANGEGVEELFVSVIVAGALIIGCGFGKVGGYVSYVPSTVMTGFCNGLAIVIGSAQIEWFQDSNGKLLEGSIFYMTVVHCLISLTIVMFLPKVTEKVPANLVALVVGIVMEYVLFRGLAGTSTITIGDKSQFPRSQVVPQLFWYNSLYDVSKIQNFVSIVLQSLTLGTVAMLEALLTLEVVNDMTKTTGDPDRQLMALGVGNILSGLFGTMGGTSLIELSVMNVHAGGTTRASSTLVAIGILLIIVFASPVLNLIPAGSLAGIVILAVIHTAKWESLPGMVAGFLPSSTFNSGDDKSWVMKKLKELRIEPYQTLVIMAVTIVTWLTNLAYGVFIGMALTYVPSLVQGKETDKAAGTRNSGKEEKKAK